MVLLLQISADDIAVAHKNSILQPLLNLIRDSFRASFGGAGEKERVSKLLTFFSSGPLPVSGIHSIMSKTGQRQAGETKLLLSDRDSTGERRVSLIYKYTENIGRKCASFFMHAHYNS